MSGLKKQKNVNYDISVVRLILMLQTLANKDVGQPDVLRFILLILPYYTIQTICQHGNDRFKRLCKNILDKKVWLWSIGTGIYGCAGDENVTSHYVEIPHPVNINVNSIVQVSIGQLYITFITNVGDLYFVGKLHSKSICDGNIKCIYKNVKQVSAGSDYLMFVTNDGDLYGLGYGKNGKLGDGDISSHIVLTPKYIFKNVKYVSCEFNHTMFITNNGNLYGMGNGNCGKLGDGISYNHNVETPTQFLKVKNVKQVSCGTYHTMFVTNNGNLYTMGFGIFGILENNILIPILIYKNVKQISCATHCASTFITNDGDLYIFYINTSPKCIYKNVKQCSSASNAMLYINDNDSVFRVDVKNDFSVIDHNCINFKNVKQIACNNTGQIVFIGSIKK